MKLFDYLAYADLSLPCAQGVCVCVHKHVESSQHRPALAVRILVSDLLGLQ